MQKTKLQKRQHPFEGRLTKGLKIDKKVDRNMLKSLASLLQFCPISLSLKAMLVKSQLNIA